MPFKLRKAAVSSPSTFEFEILTGELGDEEIHRYSLHFSSREVVFESLVQIRPASERVIFTRHARGSEHDFNLEWVERKEWTEEDRQFARFVAKGTRKNQPFLTEAVDRNLKFFTSVASWFRDSLVIVDANVEYLSLETLNENRPELRAYVARMLNGSDTGIIAVEAEPVSIDSTGIPPMSREHLASTLKEGGSGALVRSIQGQRFSVYMQGGELKAAKAKLYRKSADDDTRVAFDVSEESDGTMRLFDLLPLFHELMVKGSRRTYVVDELDKSMHSSIHLASLVRLSFEASLFIWCETLLKRVRLVLAQRSILFQATLRLCSGDNHDANLYHAVDDARSKCALRCLPRSCRAERSTFRLS